MHCQDDMGMVRQVKGQRGVVLIKNMGDGTWYAARRPEIAQISIDDPPAQRKRPGVEHEFAEDDVAMARYKPRDHCVAVDGHAVRQPCTDATEQGHIHGSE